MIRSLAVGSVVCAAFAGGYTHAAQRHAREVPQIKCSKGQYRFDARIYRCLEVTVYEIRNGRRVPRLYHVWEKRRGRR